MENFALRECGILTGSHVKTYPGIEKSRHEKDTVYHQNDHVFRRHAIFKRFLDPRII